MADPNSPAEKTEERDEVTFEGPVDSVYLGASKDYVELDVGTGAAVAISSSGWEDVVVVRAASRALLLLIVPFLDIMTCLCSP